MHVHAYVLRRVERRLAGMNADADADRTGLQPDHRLAHRRHRVLGAGERVEEGVSLVVDLVTLEETEA